MNLTNPADIKKRANEIVTTVEWENSKTLIMRDILFEKFNQNDELYYRLMNTRPHMLIEASLDDFWGSGCKLGSIALEEGIWTGQTIWGNFWYLCGIIFLVN